jgi:hypothetical protein
MRCSDGTAKERNSAFDEIKDAKIDIQTLFKMNIPLRRKMKFIPFALFGAKLHCKLIALMHKKLC